MATYYIDLINGEDKFDGLSPEKARKNYTDIDLHPNDRVLFRRGNFVRGPLKSLPHISYGAYGNGSLPTFCGSVDVSDKQYWQETEQKNVWKCTKKFRGDVGNIIFNTNECTASLRWTMNELCSQGDFYSTPVNVEQSKQKDIPAELYLYSVTNPADFYSHIEVADYGDRCLVKLSDGITLEDIHIMNSGVHGMAGIGSNITVRRCVLENIGGCPWNIDLKIRFGNAFEIWERGNHILIEDCFFKNIYDSCVTHQGPGDATFPTENFICRSCTFDTYGMAAFEYRDKLPIRSEFVHNTCLNAGCGFAMLGEELPRNSEIWPQPMGHHIFLWRIPKATDGGSLTISDNVFGSAPVGAAIYSIISHDAEAQITLKNNSYTKNDTLLIRFGGINYTELEDFTKTGNDINSKYMA